jgi:hypothetical protein
MRTLILSFWVIATKLNTDKNATSTNESVQVIRGSGMQSCNYNTHSIKLIFLFYCPENWPSGSLLHMGESYNTQH